MECIKNRRTIRKYTTQDVPSELLNSLLEEAFRASTMGNMQLYSVIVTRDMAMKEKLAVPHFHQPMVTSAPVIVTFCADFNRFTKWCELRNANPGYDNLLSFMNAATDASTAFESLALDDNLAILRNIIYSGIWKNYDKEKNDDR